ncbi:MAG: diaminopimelate epimerase [Bacillota bacterium]|jgi:diaminopimelate epimerase
MKFTKVQGIGNDFVLVEAFAGWPVADPARLAKLVCDRHFGVGADGLIFISRSQVADLSMRIWNADGSEAEMCGNAIRCLAKYAYQHGFCCREEMSVETPAGIRHIRLHLAAGQVSAVTVNMGSPILDPKLIPMGCDRHPAVLVPIVDQNQVYRVTAVSTGVPHAVVFVPDVDAVDLEEQGSFLGRHPSFPSGTNVEFVQVIDRETVKVRVWERGVGPTLACGTGACAVAVAAVLCGLTEPQLSVELPGGRLHIHWRNRQQLFMTGPAEEVFSGHWPGLNL